MKKICVFDVDGIIIDSTDECLIIAWNAYQAYIGANSYIKDVNDADNEYDEKFRATRNYVRSMGEYLVVFECEYSALLSQDDYEAKLLTLDQGNIQLFAKCFFDQRNKLKKNDYAFWLSLHRIYDGVPEILHTCNNQGNLYVVTGKDKESVIDIFNYMGININPNKVFDKNAADNKLESLKRIATIENVDNGLINFIDDNVTHLRAPQLCGFSIALGDWGYALPEHIKMAHEYNMLVIPITKVIDFMLR